MAVIGSGNIGSDLCVRLLESSDFSVRAFVGRRPDSPGLIKFKDDIPHVLSNGLVGLLSIQSEVDGFFDASSAFEHGNHWAALGSLNKWAIDLTPSKLGIPMVPSLIGESDKFSFDGIESFNFSMVICGGQSAAPIIHAISKNTSRVLEVEVSSSIASKSAGPATRLNVDQYIESTEHLVSLITDCQKVKAILVLNPAEPPVMMRTTISAKVLSCNLSDARDDVNSMVAKVRSSVPGYEIVVEPHFASDGIISTTVKITGAGYYLPPFAGNLDIINAAALETARFIVKTQETRIALND